ncbi:hypothetical protein FRB90_010374 [Tulasnella sp. 427]|nr:hypothetical protein FRB90_010374 [Tulasnella sp. 427]
MQGLPDVTSPLSPGSVVSGFPCFCRVSSLINPPLILALPQYSQDTPDTQQLAVSTGNDESEHVPRTEIDLESPDSPPPRYRARQSRDDYFSIPVYRSPPVNPGRITPEFKFRAPLATRRLNPRATDTPEGRLDPVWFGSPTHQHSSLPAFLASDPELTRTPSNASSVQRRTPSRTPPPSRPLPAALVSITLRYSGSEPVLPSYQPPKKRLTRILGGFNSLTNLGHYQTRPSINALAQQSVLSFDSTSSDSSYVTPRAEDFPPVPGGFSFSANNKRRRRRLLRPSKSIRRIREFLRRYFSQHPAPVPPLPPLPRKISSTPAAEPTPAQPSEPQNTPSMTSKTPNGASNWPTSSGAGMVPIEASHNRSKSSIHLPSSLKRHLFRSSVPARAAATPVRTDARDD